MLQRWRAVGKIASDLAGPRFEPQTSRSKHQHETAQPASRHVGFIYNENNISVAVQTTQRAWLGNKKSIKSLQKKTIQFLFE